MPVLVLAEFDIGQFEVNLRFLGFRPESYMVVVATAAGRSHEVHQCDCQREYPRSLVPLCLQPKTFDAD